MTSKELVYRAIEFEHPARIPISYHNRDFDSSDTYMVSYMPPSLIPTEPGMTEWGYIWTSLDGTMGQPHAHPLADAEKIADYIPPVPRAEGRFKHLQNVIAEHSDKFIKFSLGISGFNQATFLRGFDNYLVDLHTNRHFAEQVLDIVFQFENGVIDQLADYAVDAVVFADDWGTQQGLIISPDLWREVFRPRYAGQFARVHAAGKKVWFHCCGNIFAIIGDLIEIGVDVLELLQPDVFGVERLTSAFAGKVCFCCSVDHQRRAISGTKEEIFAYAEMLVERLGCFDGGFIAYIEDYSSLGMSEQNYQWIREAFHRY